LEELQNDPELGAKWQEMQEWQRMDGGASTNTNMGNVGTQQNPSQEQPQVSTTPTEQSFRAAQEAFPGKNPTVVLKEKEAQLNANRTPEMEKFFKDAFGYLPLPPANQPAIPTGG
jgi:hypothetical protein